MLPGTDEYLEVTNHFRSTMDLGCGVNPSGSMGFGYPKCKVFAVKRVENIQMWHSFSAKRQTMNLRAKAEGRSWPEGFGLEQSLFTGRSGRALSVSPSSPLPYLSLSLSLSLPLSLSSPHPSPPARIGALSRRG